MARRESDDSVGPKRKWYEGRFLNAKDSEVTNASQITVRESLWPLFLVTILYFLWVSYHLISIVALILIYNTNRIQPPISCMSLHCL